MTASPSKIRANARYNDTHYDQVKLNVPKGWREEVKQSARNVGESMTHYIKTATERRMEGKDGQT